MAGNHPQDVGKDVQERPGFCAVRQGQVAGVLVALDHQGDQSVSARRGRMPIVTPPHSFTHPESLLDELNRVAVRVFNKQ